MRILNIAVAAALAVAFILVIVATATPVVTSSPIPGVDISVTMWKSTTKQGDETTTISMSDYSCKPVAGRLQGAAAMSILAIFSALAAVATVVLYTLQKEVFGIRLTPITAVIPAFVCAALCALAWILQANAYNTNFDECGGAVKDSPDAKLAASFGLFVFLSIAYVAIGVVFWFFARKEVGESGSSGYSGLTA